MGFELKDVDRTASSTIIEQHSELYKVQNAVFIAVSVLIFSSVSARRSLIDSRDFCAL